MEGKGSLSRQSQAGRGVDCPGSSNGARLRWKVEWVPPLLTLRLKLRCLSCLPGPDAGGEGLDVLLEGSGPSVTK